MSGRSDHRNFFGLELALCRFGDQNQLRRSATGADIVHNRLSFGTLMDGPMSNIDSPLVDTFFVLELPLGMLVVSSAVTYFQLGFHDEKQSPSIRTWYIIWQACVMLSSSQA